MPHDSNCLSLFPRMFNTSKSTLVSYVCIYLGSAELILTPHSSPCYCEVGYLNYRYFVNFLIYVCIGMLYGAILSVRSFLSMSFRPKAVSAVWRPQRGDETAVAFSFMLCLSVGLAVACLGGFHLYLLLTAQTTIEFHGE
jgi:palmitoyltransferase